MTFALNTLTEIVSVELAHNPVYLSWRKRCLQERVDQLVGF